jgi:hypothetical protein
VSGKAGRERALAGRSRAVDCDDPRAVSSVRKAVIAKSRASSVMSDPSRGTARPAGKAWNEERHRRDEVKAMTDISTFPASPDNAWPTVHFLAAFAFDRAAVSP